MEQIIFSKQLHDVYVESRAYGDYEYKQRANWNSPNRLQRERANVLFGRVEQAIFNIANEIDTGDVAYTGTNGDYVCIIPDGIGRILFEVFIDEKSSLYIVIKEFIWDYKLTPNSWWSIIEKKQDVLDRIITETLNRVIRESILAENRKRKVLG